MEKVSSNRSFNGVHEVWSHDSGTTSCKMTFSIYLPDNQDEKKLKTLIWLSGLTCTEENFRVKSGVCLLYTSPSPRDATLSRMPSSA